MSIHPKRNKNIYVLNDSNVVIIVGVNTIAYWDFAEILEKMIRINESALLALGECEKTTHLTSSINKI